MPKPIICSSVTKHELSWGSRPDGYIVARTQADFDAKVKELHAKPGVNYVWRVDNPQGTLRLISDEQYFELFAHVDVQWTDTYPKPVEL